MTNESTGHKILKKTIKKILENAAFELVDTEVNIDIDGDDETEFSIDVCAKYKKTLFVFQCKDVETMSAPNKEFNSTKNYIHAILEKHFKVINSDHNFISDSVLNKIDDIKCCYAFTKKLKNKNMQKNVKTQEFIFWNDKAIRYYKRVSEILKFITKHEILKEFGINPTVKQTYEESAIEIVQGKNKFYLLGMHPGLLLKIAYVYRRTSNKPDAYQRIITKDRIESISKFFTSSKNLLLPNPVIIVFDEDPCIQNKIHFESDKLTFPISYCSAWIIDGQHRIFGFKEHPTYKNWDPENDDDFKIPVVAFKKLTRQNQNETFLNINYHQKKIDSVLFNDLSTIIKDLSHEITWPSLLISELNKKNPWKDMIKVSEMDTGKPISISGFAKTKLLSTLLGYSKKTNSYSGPLYNVAKFYPAKPFSDKTNKDAFDKQLGILTTFFTIVRKKVENKDQKKDKWLNSKDYGLTKFTSINALLLVLNAFLEKDPSLKNIDKFLNVIKNINFENDHLLNYGRGYPAMPKIANKIIKKMNKEYNANLKTV